mgnify:CR=1 FL=1
MTERITQYRNDGLTFDVVDSGPIDGDVVVLLHGFPQTSACWAGVATRLGAAGVRVLAVDCQVEPERLSIDQPVPVCLAMEEGLRRMEEAARPLWTGNA